MFRVIINDKKFSVEDQTPLTEILSDYSDRPIASTASTVICPLLPITKEDEKTLTKEELAKGRRTVSDKLIDRSIVVFFDQARRCSLASFDECDLSIAISFSYIDFCFSNNLEKECYSIRNPLRANDLFADNTENAKKELLSIINKKCMESIDRHRVRSINKLTISTGGLFLRLLFDSTTPQNISDVFLFRPKTTVVLPYLDDLVGADVLCESVRKKENTLIIDCENGLTLFYIDAETNTYAYMWDVDYSPLLLLAIRAAIRVLRPDNVTPFVCLYGEHAYELEEALVEEGLPFAHVEKDPFAPVNADAGFISKLEKEKKRTSFHDLLKDENFQEELTKLSLE